MGESRIAAWRYAWAFPWAFPNTALGLVGVLLTHLSGGEVRRYQGTLEASGGFARWFLRRVVGAQAMTLGHVILGVTPLALLRCRAHERAHVRQYEQWGPFFLPAYFLASFWAACRGRHYYRDNWFELDAERSERSERAARSGLPGVRGYWH
ncbi:MAG TPA: hypothetical protein VMM92_11405 [Thermoanaerobaculia bacterium]|nr:hypothetical protein [Thermoanaerobaculia bacterium]